MNQHFHNTKPAELEELGLKAINRKRFWIVVTSILAILVLAMALFQASQSIGVITAVIIFISLKKAAISYNTLGKKKAEIIGH